ncbi:hypothetical protein sos41_10920 [Alphaproteobacteria bacterium SO-S41]|nr:hypothetical protein sos41_10920 [Alphaproteobacteria bacterium SO-S41]
MSHLSLLCGRLLPASHAAARLALTLRDRVATRLVEIVAEAQHALLSAPPQPGVSPEHGTLVHATLAADLALAYARLPERHGAVARLPLGRRRGALPRLRPDRVAAMRTAIADAAYPKNRSSIPMCGFNSVPPPRKSARGAPAGILNRLTHGRHARFARTERLRHAALKAEIAELIADCNAAVALFREAALLLWRRCTATRAAIPRLGRPRVARYPLRRRHRHFAPRRVARTGQRAPPMATLAG